MKKARLRPTSQIFDCRQINFILVNSVSKYYNLTENLNTSEIPEKAVSEGILLQNSQYISDTSPALFQI